VFGWRASFALFALCGLLVFALLVWDFKETKSGRPKSLSHYISNYKVMLRSRPFWGHAICMAFSIGALYVFLGAAPLIAAKYFDMSSATLGMYMGAVPAGFMLGSFLSGRYAGRNPNSTNSLAGRVVTFTGLAAGLLMALFDVNHVLAFFGPCVFIGLGNGLTMPSANAGALSVQTELAGSAAGLASAVTLAGGAIVAAVSGLFFSDASTIPTLFSIMLVVSALGLFAAFLVVVDDRRMLGS
jgi:predicted MFS family arabinose efflux permease